MDLSWLLNKRFSKGELYIVLISITITLSNDYFNIFEIPWILLMLYSFLALSFLRFTWKKSRNWFINYKAEKENKNKQLEQQIQHEELIQMAFKGMDIAHKMEALDVIKEHSLMFDNQYKMVVQEPYKYPLVHYSNSIQNPFMIDVNMAYIPLVDISQQEGYCIVSFNELFYKLIKSHSEEIVTEYEQKKTTRSFRRF